MCKPSTATAARSVLAQNDPMSALLAAEVDGEHLSDLELLGFCGLLLVAGDETTTNLIGNLILCLDEKPGVVECLRANRALVSGKAFCCR